ncbi:hypothetical protein [Pedobacter immunditicola]|uniref:hypothetical protein n=1 Tax=Pedobacter immunditicola TaxID=3133440 RepID=UPI00309AA1B8
MMEEQDTGKLKNQEDVNPTSQQDQIAKENDEESIPLTNGTGSNNPVPTAGTVIIKEDEDGGNENEEDEDRENKKEE